MSRRTAPGNFLYHMLDRANGLPTLCEDACPQQTQERTGEKWFLTPFLFPVGKVLRGL